ncbi:calcium-translocating P-type ATPase, SERCA-type [Ammoniphilus sp. CFH 90114]|uniref:calcium-translocating P-type ATPase, SERCA-type n=1 Tax=Ammoniphilus sp. CFH 90114 TaxID=2493665 RepID=UPI00100E9040|nr:calcium-translocating P-type ATPase, SERCA-type [Ammoniphilus sp. CFH 90114]RXT15512.1 calcium-translocating P-type ATPase, SERCA-type [Ammoniphilus sp. CFH 90114]
MDTNQWYNLTIQECIDRMQTDPVKGLSSKEASIRLEQVGENILQEKQKVSPFVILLNQFKDFMVLVLLAATLISGLLGEYTDAITIIAIVIINGILGFIQEYRAEKSLGALKELTAPTAHVVRDGELMQIQAKQIVPGDLVYFEGGDRIPADLRILTSQGLQIEESALTGESVPVSKIDGVISQQEVPLGDQKNMAFMGTLVTRGTGQGVVTGTGMHTEMGKIADLIQTTDSMQTPLQQRLEQLGKILIVIALALTAVVVIAGIMHNHNPYQMFLAGVSLAVAAIPEGLPAIVTIALALGVQRMIKRKAIVRKLPSVETLGCASVICSDKTGTLTQNKMTVRELWVEGKQIEVSGTGYQPLGNFILEGKEVYPDRHAALMKLLEINVLCNNARLVEGKEGKKSILSREKKEWTIIGDPTEGALMVVSAKARIEPNSLLQWERLKEFPFDSERKMMSVLLRHRKGEQMVGVKGAPDVLLARCTHILWNGKVSILTPTIRKEIMESNQHMAEQALRVLGVAYRDVASGERIVDENQAENKLVFVGLCGMIDPPREEVKEAIRKCRVAGIKTVMITGDHQTTAEAIARQLGILPRGGLTINGQDLYNMSDEEFDKKVEQIYVYARVSPEHKLKIVRALQAKGHVVAMTGDGVNDAPAIKAANIGIAMGITGTDVSKEASSLVLADDNFATIEAAIEEGRTIYDNIRKFIRYLLASNVGEILVMFFAMIAGMPLPLVPIQILWVNLVTDGLPAMALGVDQAEGNTMKRPPRPSRESIFARGLGWKILSRGFLIGICTLGAFWITLQANPDDLTKAQTMAFATLVMAQLIHVFDCRSERTVFHRNPLQNKWLVVAVIVSVLLLIGVIYLEPLQPIFKTVALDIQEWFILLIFAAIPTVAVGVMGLLWDALKGRRTA